MTPEVADAYDRVLGTGGTFREALIRHEAEPWDQVGNIAALIQLLDRNDVDLIAAASSRQQAWPSAA